MGSGRWQPDPILTDRAALAALIEAGLTPDEIAERCTCSRTTLRLAMRRLGLPPFAPGRPPTPELADRDTLAAFIASGMTTWQIAEQLGCSTNIVRRWVRRHELTFPPHSGRRPNPPKLRDVAWLREQHHDRGRSLTDIGRELDRPQTMISRRFGEYGIPVRYPRTYPQLRDPVWLDAQFAAGKSCATIAAEVECTHGAVWQAAIAQGITPRARR